MIYYDSKSASQAEKIGFECKNKLDFYFFPTNFFTIFDDFLLQCFPWFKKSSKEATKLRGKSKNLVSIVHSKLIIP